MVRRFVEQQQVRGLDPEQRQLQPRPFAAGERPNLLVDVIAAEQEPREVRPRLARGHGDDLEQRVEDGRPGDGRDAELRQVPEADAVPERQRPVERWQLPGDRAQERGLAGAVGADDPDPLTALCREERDARHDPRFVGRRAVRGQGAAPGQVADREALGADDDLA